MLFIVDGSWHLFQDEQLFVEDFLLYFEAFLFDVENFDFLLSAAQFSVVAELNSDLLKVLFQVEGFFISVAYFPQEVFHFHNAILEFLDGSCFGDCVIYFFPFQSEYFYAQDFYFHFPDV